MPTLNRCRHTIDLRGAGRLPVTSYAVRQAARARFAVQGSSVRMFKTAAVMPAFKRHVVFGDS